MLGAMGTVKACRNRVAKMGGNPLAEVEIWSAWRYYDVKEGQTRVLWEGDITFTESYRGALVFTECPPAAHHAA